MNKLILILGSALLAPLANAAIVPLVNGDMETGDYTGWQGYVGGTLTFPNAATNIVDATSTYWNQAGGVDSGVGVDLGGGSYSMRIGQFYWLEGFAENDVANNIFQTQDISADNGTTVRFTSDLYISSLEPYSGNSTAYMFVKFFNSDYSYYFPESVRLDITSTPQDSWTTTSIDVTVPTGAVFMQTGFETHQINWGGGSVYFDDASVSAVPEPATFALVLSATLGGLVFWRRRLKNQAD